MPLGGYTAREGKVFEPGGENLKARVAIFTKGETKVALVSLEMLTVPESLMDEVKKRIPPGVNLMMVATHTHCAPDSQMLNDRMTFRIPGIATYSHKWLEWYADEIGQTVTAALAAKQSKVGELDERYANVDFNRGRREGAEPDKAFKQMTIGPLKLLNYAAHATFYDETRLKLSGDWPGAMMGGEEKIVLPAAIGDVSPQVPGLSEGASAEQKIQVFCKTMNGKLASAKPEKEAATLQFAQQPIDLPAVVPNPAFAKEYKVNDAIAGLLVKKFAPTSASLTGLVLGDTLIVGVPGEPTSELGRRIQEACRPEGFKHVWVVSHCNGWVGYILMPEDYDRGGYEATLAFHGRNLSDKVIEASEKLAAQLRPRSWIGQRWKLRLNTTRFIETTASLAAAAGS